MRTVCCTVWACSLLIRGVHAIGCVARRLLRHPHVCGAISMCAYLSCHSTCCGTGMDIAPSTHVHACFLQHCTSHVHMWTFTCSACLTSNFGKDHPRFQHGTGIDVNVKLLCMPPKLLWQAAVLLAALGVVGMLRRLTLWTEEDAWNGKLTILPRNIVAWLRNTSRYTSRVPV